MKLLFNFGTIQMGPLTAACYIAGFFITLWLFKKKIISFTVRNRPDMDYRTPLMLVYTLGITSGVWGLIILIGRGIDIFLQMKDMLSFPVSYTWLYFIRFCIVFVLFKKFFPRERGKY
jgi:hypothetical protein